MVLQYHIIFDNYMLIVINVESKFISRIATSNWAFTNTTGKRSILQTIVASAHFVKTAKQSETTSILIEDDDLIWNIKTKGVLMMNEKFNYLVNAWFDH